MIDPTCSLHGRKWSEHPEGRCLYCCVCFRTLTREECWSDAGGQRWDLCQTCGVEEEGAQQGVPPAVAARPDTVPRKRG